MDLVEADMGLLRRVIEGSEMSAEDLDALMAERRKITEQFRLHGQAVAQDPALATGYELNNFLRKVAFSEKHLSVFTEETESPLLTYMRDLPTHLCRTQLSPEEQDRVRAVLGQVGGSEWLGMVDDRGFLQATQVLAFLRHVADYSEEGISLDHPEMRLRYLAYEVILRAIYLEARASGLSHEAIYA